MEKYAVVLKRQSRFAPTRVGEFIHVQKYNRHLWKGETASSMAELAEQTNAAIQALVDFNDPFLRFEIVKVESIPKAVPAWLPPDDVTGTHVTGTHIPQRKLNVVGGAGCQINQEAKV